LSFLLFATELRKYYHCIYAYITLGVSRRSRNDCGRMLGVSTRLTPID